MRRTLVVLVATSLLMLGLVSPAAAQDEDFKFRDSFTGQMADAFWFSCEPDTPDPGLETCTFTDVVASSGTVKAKGGPGKPATFTVANACIFTSTVVFTSDGEFVDEEGFRFGCDEDPSLTIASDLSSATLTANITFVEFVCEEDPDTGEFICEEIPIGSAALSATWTGTGPLTKFRDHSRSVEISPDHRCTFSSSGRGVRREAMATGTLDGMPLGDSEFAFLSDGTFKFSASCRFK